MIFHRLDAGNVLRSDTGHVPVRRLLDSAPEADDTIADCDPDEELVHARVLPNSGRDRVTKGAVIWACVFPGLLAARPRSKSARLTMPTREPLRVIGTRFICRVSRREAMCSAELSSSAVTTSWVMTSLACRPWLLTKRRESSSGKVRNANHHDERPSVSNSGRRIRSPSLTMPRIRPEASTTGTALMRLSSSSPAISATSAFGSTVRADPERC